MENLMAMIVMVLASLLVNPFLSANAVKEVKKVPSNELVADNQATSKAESEEQDEEDDADDDAVTMDNEEDTGTN